MEKNGQRRLITKGSPEGILGLCVACESGGSEQPFNRDAQTRSRAVFEQLDAQGYRVLAVAHRLVEEQRPLSARDESGLTLAGFLAFSDPPLPDAARTIEDLHSDGVTVKIISGDSELVACHICGKIGLLEDRPVLGGRIDAMTDAGEKEFHTGWFVESLATQTLVLFVIRTLGNPLASRPSKPLATTVLAVTVVALALPYSPLAPVLGFVPLPVSYMLYVAAATVTYLLLVQVVKRMLFRTAAVAAR